MEAEVIAKKWGNSLGVILPSEVVTTEKIKENEKIVIEIKKRQLGCALMGLLKSWNTPPKTIKDEARRGCDLPLLDRKIFI